MEASDEIDIKEESKKEDNQAIVYAVISPTGEILYNQRITSKEALTV